MTMLQTKFMDNYIDQDSNAGVFMSALLFQLIFGFSDTSKIFDFNACFYASIFLNHYYVEYYMKYDDYYINGFPSNEKGKAKSTLHFCLSVSFRKSDVC